MVFHEAAGSSGFGVHDVEDLIVGDADEIFSSDLVGVEIDRVFGLSEWQGNTLQDRTTHLASVTARDLLTQMERSLLQQEAYEDFEARMLRFLGAEDPAAPAGVLAKWNNQLRVETKLAWSTATASATQERIDQGRDELVAVWEAVLDDRTTPQCWENHGRLIVEEIGAWPPAHPGCRCVPKMIMNPDSADEDWAQTGQDVLAEMTDERESGDAPLW